MTNNEQKLDDKKSHFIIEGITLNQEIFRPSDWAERMCDALSQFKGRRICYSPLLQPITHEGHRSVIVSKDLQHQYPALFEEIMYFARSNRLKITEEADPEPKN